MEQRAEQASIASRPVTVEITRTFNAPRERVFRAWTDAKDLECWFAPSPDYTIVVPELDLRPGGRYVVEMHHKGGNVHRAGGTYREVSPPEKLSFTWQWQGQGNESAAESVVSVYFRDLGKTTEIRLTHELLPSAEEREQHAQGWNGCFAQLDSYL
jgi:uncharacterized protein YndB with AHSA1/START domain